MLRLRLLDIVGLGWRVAERKNGRPSWGRRRKPSDLGIRMASTGTPTRLDSAELGDLELSLLGSVNDEGKGFEEGSRLRKRWTWD